MTFVLIIGPPRTGTSLMVDLIRKCGFNFGSTTTPKDSRKRMGQRSPRNEHNATMKGKMPSDPKTKLKKFKQAGITGNKIVNAFHLWVPHFAKMFGDLRIIIMRREQESALKSVKEIAEQWKPEKRKEYWNERQRWAKDIAESDEYKTLVVDFETLIKKDDNLLQTILDFVGSNKKPDDLKHLIKPELNKNG